MADTPYPLPRETRESTILVGDGTVGPYGPSAYKVFDTADVRVWAKTASDEFFVEVTDAVTVTKTAALEYDTFSVIFDNAISASTQWYHQAARVAERSVAVTRAGALAADQLEKELSKQATAQSELRRDVGRGVRIDFDQPAQMLPAPVSGKLVGFNANLELDTFTPTDLGATLALAGDKGLPVFQTNTASELAQQIDWGGENPSADQKFAIHIIRGNHILTPYEFGVSRFDDRDGDYWEPLTNLFGEGANSWNASRQAFDVQISGACRQWRSTKEHGVVGLKQPGLIVRDIDIRTEAGTIGLNFGDSNHVRFFGYVGVYADSDHPLTIGMLTGCVDTGAGFRPSPAVKNDGIINIRGKVFDCICNFGGEVFELGEHYLETTSRSPLSALYATIASGQAFADRYPGLTSILCTLPNGTTSSTARSDIVHKLGMPHMAHRADYNLPITGYDTPSGSAVVIHSDPAKLAASGFVNGNPIAIAGVTTTVVTPGKKKLNSNWFNIESVDTVAGTFALTATDGDNYDAWLSGGNVTPRSGPAVYVEGASAIKMDEGGYLIVQGNTLVQADGSYDGALRDINIDCQGETQPTSIMRVKVSASGTTLQGLDTHALSAAQTYGVALFVKEGAGALTVQGHDLWVNSMPDVPPGGIWQDEDGDQSSINIVDANYRLPKAAIADVAVQNAGFAGFTGTITTLDDGRTRTFTKPRAWTPALKFGGAAVGMTYAAGGQLGWVEDAGEFQIAHFRIALSAKGSSTGNATIEGLLDAVGYSGSGTGNSGSLIVDSYAALASVTAIMGRVPAGLTSITLTNGGAASSTAMTEANFTDTSVLEGTVIYRLMA